MKRLKNLVGQRYGRILVIEKTDQLNEQNSPIYKCKCECGKETFLTSNSLNHKKGTRSCGCGRTPYKHALSYGESSMRVRYNQYKSGAKARRLEFELSLEDFHSITQRNCYYCNVIPQQSHKGSSNGRMNGEYIYNGIDRLDNSQGYIPENCVPCCGKCNRAKRNMTQIEFLNLVEAIHEVSMKGRDENRSCYQNV